MDYLRKGYRIENIAKREGLTPRQNNGSEARGQIAENQSRNVGRLVEGKP